MSDHNDTPTARIPLLEPEDMTPEQLADYQRRAASRTPLSQLLAHTSTVGPAIAALNEALATSITVPPLEREIVTLAVLHLERGEYEWALHMEVAKFMEIPQAKIDAIASERFGNAVFTDRERALLAFTRQVVKTVRVDDATFDAIADFYDPRQIVEILIVISNYMMLTRLSEVTELPVTSLVGADFWTKRDTTP